LSASLGKETSPAAGRRLVSESLVYAGVDVAQNVIALIVVPASLFWLTPTDMGTVTVGLLVSQIVLTIAALGLDFALLRFYLRWPEHERTARTNGVLVICAATSALLTVGAIAAWAFTNRTGLGPWAAAVAAGAGLAVRGVPLAVFRVTSQLTRYATVTVGGSILQAILQIAALVAGGGVFGFLAALAAASWIGAGGACVYLMINARQRPLWPDRDAVRLAASNLGAGLFNRLVGGADRFALLGWSTMDSLGVYGTAARWTMPLRTVSGGTKLALAPALSRAEAGTEDRILPGASIRPFVTMLAMFAALLQLSSWCLVLTPWRTELVQFQRLLALLVVAQLLGALTLMGQTLLYYRDRPGWSTALAALTAVLTVAGLTWLVPLYGATGAALVQVAANLVTLVVCVGFALNASEITRDAVWPVLILLAIGVSQWFVGSWASGLVALAGTGLLMRSAWQDLDGPGWLGRLRRHS
jgi:O-antigen/teichoic acid export membrane protein